MTPRDVDALSLREVFLMIAGAKHREKALQEESWKRSLTLTQAVINTVSKKPKPLDDLWRQMKQGPRPTMPLQEYREWRNEAVRKIKERYVNTYDA